MGTAPSPVLLSSAAVNALREPHKHELSLDTPAKLRYNDFAKRYCDKPLLRGAGIFVPFPVGMLT